MKTVGIGMVGCGYISEVHAESIKRVAGYDARIVAVAAPSARRPAFQERHGITSGYDSYDELLADPAVDVVDICTPPDLHADMVEKALRAGKHVICEKPLTGFFDTGDGGADSVDRQVMYDSVMAEMNRLRDLLDQTGLTFCYAENYVYAPSVQKSREFIEKSGAQILLMRGEGSHSGSHARHAAQWRYAGGGVMIRQGCHPLSAILYMKRAEARARGVDVRLDSVLGDCVRLTPTLAPEARTYIEADPVDVEDCATTILAFSDGTRAVVQAGDMIVGGVRNSLEVFTNHSVHLCKMTQNDAMQVYHEDPRSVEDVYFTEKLGHSAGWQFVSLDEMLARGYVGEMQDFVECIAEGRAPESGFDLAYESMRAIYAGYLSAATSQRVVL